MSDPAPRARTIRVALAGLTGLGAASIRGCLSGHSDITIVTELTGAEIRDTLVTPIDVDVLVTTHSAQDGGIPGACREQLFADAGVPVIAVSVDGRLEIYDKRVLREATLAELLAEVRRVATSVAVRLPTHEEARSSWPTHR
jgi:hypothetical protein